MPSRGADALVSLDLLPTYCPMCGSRLAHLDNEIGCTKCGYVSDETIYGQNTNYKDEDGNSTSQNSPGLGTDAAEAASKYLKKITKGHVLKSQGNKYLTYALSCLASFIKSNTKFKDLREVLRVLVTKSVSDYVSAKKMAREGITETKVVGIVKGKKQNHIRYYAIDRVIENTILAFCSKNKSYAQNIKIESFNLHKAVRHCTRGNKHGTTRENGYKDPNPALEVHSCLKHGPFAEKSHNAHFKNSDHSINERQVTFPTYQKYFVLGFSYCEDILKNSVKQNYVQRQNVLRGNSSRCDTCNCEIKEEVRASYHDTKEKKHKKYTCVIKYHILRINGRKVRVKGCVADYNTADMASKTGQDVFNSLQGILWYESGNDNNSEASTHQACRGQQDSFGEAREDFGEVEE